MIPKPQAMVSGLPAVVNCNCFIRQGDSGWMAAQMKQGTDGPEFYDNHGSRLTEPSEWRLVPAADQQERAIKIFQEMIGRGEMPLSGPPVRVWE